MNKKVYTSLFALTLVLVICPSYTQDTGDGDGIISRVYRIDLGHPTWPTGRRRRSIMSGFMGEEEAEELFDL